MSGTYKQLRLRELSRPPIRHRPCLDEAERKRMDELQSQPGFPARYRIMDPCRDCLAGFAAEMRDIGKCDGSPKGEVPDEEELEVWG